MRQVFGWRSLVGSGLVLVGVLAVGCSTSDRPPVSQLKQGLNLLDVRDPSWGMNAAFVKNDRVVYLKTANWFAQARHLSSGVAERSGERDRPAVHRSERPHLLCPAWR